MKIFTKYVNAYIKPGKRIRRYLYYEVNAVRIDIYTILCSIYIAHARNSIINFEDVLFLLLDIILFYAECNKDKIDKNRKEELSVLDDYKDMKELTNFLLPLIITFNEPIAMFTAIIFIALLDKTSKRTKKELKIIAQIVATSSVFYNSLFIETSKVAIHPTMNLLLIFILYHIFHLYASIRTRFIKYKNFSKGKPLFTEVYDDIEIKNMRYKSYSIDKQTKLFVRYKRLKM